MRQQATTNDRPYIIVDEWGEPARAYVGDTVHYKLGYERCGKIAEISGDFARVNNLWNHQNDLWME